MNWLKRLLGQTSAAPDPDALDASQDAPAPPSAEVLSRMAEFERICWPWSLSPDTGTGRETRFGGHPYMGAGEDWPVCADCGTAMSFHMQCDLDAVPETAPDFGGGLVRLFYCMTDECAGMGGWDADDPQNSAVMLRGDGVLREASEGVTVLPALQVTWQAQVADYPHGEDHSIEGLENQWDYSVGGQKFGGWPNWYQGPERPNCPQCGTTMRYVLQLDDTPQTDFNFGGGTGHITQCPKHLDQLGFGWACG